MVIFTHNRWCSSQPLIRIQGRNKGCYSTTLSCIQTRKMYLYWQSEFGSYRFSENFLTGNRTILRTFQISYKIIYFISIMPLSFCDQKSSWSYIKNNLLNFMDVYKVNLYRSSKKSLYPSKQFSLILYRYLHQF